MDFAGKEHEKKGLLSPSILNLFIDELLITLCAVPKQKGVVPGEEHKLLIGGQHSKKL